MAPRVLRAALLSSLAAMLLLVAGPAGGQQQEEAALRTYNNYTVLRVVPQTEEQVRGLRELEAKAGVDVWVPARRGAAADFMVSPEAQSAVADRLRALGLGVQLLHRDLQDSVDTERWQARRAQRARRASRSPSYTRWTPPFPVLPRGATPRHQGQVDREMASIGVRFRADAYIDNQRYLLYDEIENYITQMAANHPNKVKLHDIGKTSEGRTMRVVQLTNCAECKYPAIWIDAGIHAREWIAPATALYALSQLAENETAHADMRRQLDWFILPVANPDGYQFTHTTDRMWRKTRSKTSRPGCYGVDPNRNFEFHWNEVGASSDPCSDTYAGRKAFSEPETNNMRNFIWANRMNIKLYISYHAYGNLLLYPWGFKAENPKDWQLLKSVATKANDAMVRAGSEPYTIGSSTQTLYAAAGGSDDWAKGIAGIPLSYTIELPGYNIGFQLPPRFIDEVVKQSFEGLRVFASEVKRLYGSGSGGGRRGSGSGQGGQGGQVVARRTGGSATPRTSG